MSRKLDTSKPYAEVFGDGEKHRFEQDGLRFDNSGDEIVDTAAPEGGDQFDQQAPTKAETKKAKGKAEGGDQVDQQLAG